MKNRITFISLFVITFLISMLFIATKTIENTYAIGTSLADTVINLAATSACNAGGTGVCATNSYTDTDSSTKYHDYRYKGAEPNNYVSFNNDMYRIIGVFDSNSHGKSGEYLVKLIRDRILYAGSWGVYNTTNTSGTYSSNKNDWTGNTTGVKASANVILNEFFYNRTNTSSVYGNCSDWAYYYNANGYKPVSCSEIVGYGIKDNYRNYIEEVTWYLKGYGGASISKQNFYLCERGLNTATNCNSGNAGAYDAITTANIGLMYVSDFLYASSYYADSSTATGNSAVWANKNWLHVGTEWTITETPNTTYAFRFDKTSTLGVGDTTGGYGIRPTFYLKSNVNVTGGTGTFDDPYTISM